MFCSVRPCWSQWRWQCRDQSGAWIHGEVLSFDPCKGWQFQSFPKTTKIKYAKGYFVYVHVWCLGAEVRDEGQAGLGFGFIRFGGALLTGASQLISFWTMNVIKEIRFQSLILVPWTGIQSIHPRSIIQSTIIKVAVGEGWNHRMHPVLHTQQLNSLRITLLDSLEQTLFIRKNGCSLWYDSRRELIGIYQIRIPLNIIQTYLLQECNACNHTAKESEH